MKSNWLFWGLAAIVIYSIAKSFQVAAPKTYPFVGPINQPDYVPTVPFVGPINQPGYYPFVGPINQPASTGGGAATDIAQNPSAPALDEQTAAWDPCYTGSLVYDPSACSQSGRTTY